MKKKSLLVLLLVFGCIEMKCATANETLKTQEDVVADYTKRSNKDYEPIFSIKQSDVRAEKVDVNNDGATDFILYDKNRCGSSTGCREDIYLCKITETECKDGTYCFAGSLYEGQLKTKGKTLKCK